MIQAGSDPVDDAWVRIDTLDGVPVLVDPGECDDIGEARCFHPGGIYGLPEAAVGGLRIWIDADAGPDWIELGPLATANAAE